MIPVPTPSRLRRLPWLPLLLAIVLAGSLVLALEFWTFGIDDSYISLRYAQNWLDGLGLVYNQGERVEGFSNPPWVLLLALGLLLGFQGLAFSKVTGLLCLPVTIIASYHLAQRLVRPTRAWSSLVILLVVAFLALSLPMTFQTQTGLETSSYVALLMAALWRLDIESEDPRRYPVSALLGAFAALSRPEAPALVFGLVLGRFMTAIQRARAREGSTSTWTAMRGLGAWLGLLLTPCIAYLLFRLTYYGHWVANTYYAKGSSGRWELLQDYLRSYVFLEPALILVGLVGILLFLFQRHGTPAKEPVSRIAPLLVVLVMQLLFLLWIATDWMPNHRFLVPLLPPFLVLGAAGFGRLVENRPGFRAWVSILLLGALSFQLSRTFPIQLSYVDDTSKAVTLRPKTVHFPFFRGTVWQGTIGDVAWWALENVPENASIVLSEIGVAGLVGPWTVIDFCGLTDRVISGSTGQDWPGRVRYLHGRKADWIVVNTRGSSPSKLLRAQRWLFEEYELSLGPRNFWIARKKGSPIATDQEALANLERAVRLEPRYLVFWARLIRWTAWMKGRDAALTIVNDYLEHFPGPDNRAATLLALVDPPESSPRSLNKPFPETLLGTNPFREPGKEGVGVGWASAAGPVPPERAFIENHELVLDNRMNDQALLLCGPPVRPEWRPVELSAQVLVETEGPHSSLELTLRDRRLRPVFSTTIHASEDWIEVRETAASAASNARVQLCLSLEGEGRARVRDLAAWVEDPVEDVGGQ